MKAPWKYRPQKDELDWEDNAISNSIAWLSRKLTPRWCASDDHWSVKMTGYLWAECPCCLSLRWVVVGALLGFVFGLLW